MKLAGIFQDLEHLYDFETISYGDHFVFQNETKMLQRQVFIAINIPCKFGGDIFINGRTDGRRFIISQPRPSAAGGR